ncbi:MAG: glycosyltransferase family 39 protein [archaeon]
MGRKRVDILLIVALFVFSLVLRLIFMNAALWHHDSVQFAISTENTLETGRLHGLGGGKEGMILITTVFYGLAKIFGARNAEYTVTFVTILFAAGSVSLMYIFTRQLMPGRLAAFASGFMLSVSPIFLANTTYAKSHAFSVFFQLLSAIILIRAIRTDRKAYQVLAGFFLMVSFFMRAENILLLLPFAVMAFCWRRQKTLPLFQLSALAFFTCVFFAFSYGEFMHSAGYNSYAVQLDSFILPIKWLYLSMTFVGFLLLLLGLLTESNKNLVPLFAWFAVFFFYFSIVRSSSPRFFIPCLIPVFIICSRGILTISRRYFRTAILILVLVSSLMIISIYPVISYRHENSGQKALGDLLRSATEPGAKVLIMADDYIFVEYYGNRTPINCYPNELRDRYSEIVSMVYNGTPVYYFENCLYLFGQKDVNVPYELNTRLRNRFIFEEVGPPIQYEEYHKTSVSLKNANFTLYRLVPRNVSVVYLN